MAFGNVADSVDGDEDYGAMSFCAEFEIAPHSRALAFFAFFINAAYPALDGCGSGTAICVSARKDV